MTTSRRRPLQAVGLAGKFSLGLDVLLADSGRKHSALPSPACLYGPYRTGPLLTQRLAPSGQRTPARRFPCKRANTGSVSARSCQTDPGRPTPGTPAKPRAAASRPAAHERPSSRPGIPQAPARKAGRHAPLPGRRGTSPRQSTWRQPTSLEPTAARLAPDHHEPVTPLLPTRPGIHIGSSL